MNEFIYTLRARRPGLVIDGPSPEESPVIERHVRYLSELASDGTVILAGRTQNRDESSFGIVIVRAESRKRAERVMSRDPAVEAGLMEAELYPFRVAVAAKGQT